VHFSAPGSASDRRNGAKCDPTPRLQEKTTGSGRVSARSAAMASQPRRADEHDARVLPRGTSRARETVQCAALRARADRPPRPCDSSATSTATKGQLHPVEPRPAKVSTSTTARAARARPHADEPAAPSRLPHASPPPIRQTRPGAVLTSADGFSARRSIHTSRPLDRPSDPARPALPGHPRRRPANRDGAHAIVNTDDRDAAPERPGRPPQARMDAGPASAAASLGSSNRLGRIARGCKSARRVGWLAGMFQSLRSRSLRSNGRHEMAKTSPLDKVKRCTIILRRTDYIACHAGSFR